VTASLIVAAGWIGQALFFSRFLVQWWHSERAGRSVAPVVFWWLSLGGTLLVGLYAAWRGDAVLLPAFAINIGIYLRNLLLSDPRTNSLRVPLPIAAGLGLAGAFLLMTSGAFEPRTISDAHPIWYVLGVIGTTLWASRFLVQWWQSERLGESRFTLTFWWISLFGNAFLLAYALRLGDALFIAGFVPGPLVQLRNLQLESRRLAAERAASDADLAHHPAGASGA
jgi:lipid-A-disaccharide synthase-like uncharacterized protein